MNLPITRPLCVVLLGPPGAGKGTQGKRLAGTLGLSYLGTGALLRQHMKEGTALGRVALPILARGEYLADHLICPILGDWLGLHSRGWVLDGFPRSLSQAIFLDEWLAHRNFKLDAAISLDVSLREMIDRVESRVECPGCHWSGGRGQLAGFGKCPKCEGFPARRADDTEGNFRSRHAEFVSLTQPVIEHYRRLNLLYSCDATPPQDEVASLLLEKFTYQSLS